MSEKNIQYIECNNKCFDNSRYKNREICNSDKEYIGFVNGEVATPEEIQTILDEYNMLNAYDVVAFGDKVPYGEANLESTVAAFDMDIFGFVFKREIMIQVGCFNEKLEGMTNYEFLCRLAEQTIVFFVNCQSEEREKKLDAKTLAYISRRYLHKFSKDDADIILSSMINAFSLTDEKDKFMEEINKFLSNNDIYNEIVVETSPFLIISGDDRCYGVLRKFADLLADALVDCGQAIITTNGKYGVFNGDEGYGDKVLKGIIGFQALAMEKGYIRSLPWMKIQFFLDDPMLFNGHFNNLDGDYYVLCQDANYAKDLRRYFNVKNAIHFPPAGERVLPIGSHKEYDIAFMGTYHRPCLDGMNDEEKLFYDFMLENHNLTFTDGLKAFLKKEGQECVGSEEFKKKIFSLKKVCDNVRFAFREKVIDEVVDSGYEIHLYGNSWLDYHKACETNVVIHPDVPAEETLNEYKKAKIQLNIMSWHKAGMTERIADAMLAGAVCLSDETTYLREHFTDGKDIVLYKLGELDRLKEKIDKILNDDIYRESIIQAAYKKAKEEHTWKNRAEELLELLRGNILGNKNSRLLQQIEWKYDNYDYRKFYEFGKIYEKTNADKAVICYRQAKWLCDDKRVKEDIDFQIKKLDNGNVKKTSIVILSYNTLSMTKACIESIKKNLPQDEYELILVDNCSNDGSVEYLEGVDDIKLICNKENKGFGGGCNQGIMIAEKENDIWLLNSDTLVPANSLFWLKMGLYENEKVGATGSISNNVPNYQMIFDNEINDEKYYIATEKYNIYKENALEEKNWLVGFSMLIKRNVLEETGYLDERFFPGNYEDNDISHRILRQGYKLYLCNNSFIWHYGSVSFKTSNTVNSSYIVNQMRFADKWNYIPDEFAFIKNGQYTLMEENRNSVFSLLDMDAGVGTTLSKIKYMYPNADVAGVESNQYAAEIAKLNGFVIENDFDKKFDYILINDIDENKFITAKSYLEYSGKIIFSFSNLVYDAKTGNVTEKVTEESKFIEELINTTRNVGFDVCGVLRQNDKINGKEVNEKYCVAIARKY